MVVAKGPIGGRGQERPREAKRGQGVAWVRDRVRDRGNRNWT
jgi:hypothetical protein